MTEPATFSLFVRTLPPSRGFLVAAGLEDVLRLLAEFEFDDTDLAWLAEQGFDAPTIDALAAAAVHGGCVGDPRRSRGARRRAVDRGNRSAAGGAARRIDRAQPGHLSDRAGDEGREVPDRRSWTGVVGGLLAASYPRDRSELRCREGGGDCRLCGHEQRRGCSPARNPVRWGRWLTRTCRRSRPSAMLSLRSRPTSPTVRRSSSTRTTV